MRKQIFNLLKTLLLGEIIGLVIVFCIVQYQNNNTILLNKIADVSNQLKSSERITDYTIRGIELDFDSKINGVQANAHEQTKKLEKKIDTVPETIRREKLFIEAKLQQVNVFVINQTLGATGSGVTIKYKDNFYILTAGHMAEEDTDKLFLSENGNRICELEIVKHDYSGSITSDGNDLLLLKPKDIEIVPRFYVELANFEPNVSTELYIVGNPMGLEDVISDARVITYEGNFLYVKGDSYFGNSGGGIFTRDGKLVGIMSHIYPIEPYPDTIYQPGNQVPPVLIPGIPPYVIHGAVRLREILKFLEDVK